MQSISCTLEYAGNVEMYQERQVPRHVVLDPADQLQMVLWNLTRDVLDESFPNCRSTKSPRCVCCNLVCSTTNTQKPLHRRLLSQKLFSKNIRMNKLLIRQINEKGVAWECSSVVKYYTLNIHTTLGSIPSTDYRQGKGNGLSLNQCQLPSRK